jgi:hypothetical protein
MSTPLLVAAATCDPFHVYQRAHYALLHIESKLGYRTPLHEHIAALVLLMIALLLASSRLLVRSTLARLLLIGGIAGSSALCASSTSSSWAPGWSSAASSSSATNTHSGAAIDANAARWAVDMVQEEVIGPFPSWANLKTDYGAVGDGATDDTAALQRALNDLGHAGKAQVLYLPAGTYRITATLHLTGSWEKKVPDTFGWGGLGIIGADPATTTIKWAGPADQAMLIQNGGLGYRYNRITWDGSGSAGFGVAHWWNAKGGRLYGGSFEHQDEVFRDMKIGIMAGRLGANYGELDSEGQVRRVTFINNSYAGLDTGSFNALDWWVWDSHFIHCARGVTNQYSFDDFGQTRGAGAMYVYRSLFEGSTVADVAIANTGWFSLHNNVSIGSRRFFEAAPMGANSAVVIAQDNRIVQSTNATPISLGNTGPLLLVDNQIQASRSSYELTDWITGRDVLSLGNHLSAPPPAPSGSDRLLSVDDVSVPTASISTEPMALPSTPGWTRHEVFEVPTNASADQIQALISQAARSTDPQPIIHFGQGTWALNRSLQIPRHGSVQLVGDGYGSILSWSGSAAAGPMLNIAAPGKVTIRDLQWLALSTTAIKISGADQAGGRIQIVASSLGPVVATHLERTQLSLQVNPTIDSISFNDVIHAVAVSSGPLGPVNLTNHSDFLMADSWYEGNETALFRMDSATFTYLGGHMAPATHRGAINLSEPDVLLNQFQGVASWIGMQLDLSAVPSGIGIQVDGENAQTRAYFLGTTSYVPNYFRRAGGTKGLGTIGFILNRTAQVSTDTQAANLGASSADDIVNAWSQARSLSWDSTPYQVPADSVDIRIYHVKMDQTAGLVINGQ